MRASDDSTRSSNAFSASFLRRINERDEPYTADEADHAGPWRILELPGPRFAVFRLGESPSRGHRPVANMTERWLALLVAAALPSIGRDFAFWIEDQSGPEGFPLAASNGSAFLGVLQQSDQRMLDALHLLEGLMRSPEALANLLEAAGALALERAGAILEERFSQSTI